MSVTKCTRNNKGKKSIFYRAQIYIDGVRMTGQVFDTASAAHAWHDKERSRLLSGDDVVVDETFTFGDCLKKYVAEALPRLKLSSQQDRETRLCYMTESPLVRLPMCRLKSKAVDGWICWLLKHPTAKNPGRRSFNHEIRVLSAILNWYKNYVDADFVVPITKRHRELAHYKEVKSRRPDYFARPEEIQRWISWLVEHRKPVYSRLARFMILTGARVSEASGLMWDAIDLDNSIARVFRRVRWDHWTRMPNLEDTTKTDESVRILVLPETLVVMLKEMKLESGGEGPVFRARQGGLLKYNAIQSAFNKGFISLGLPWRSTHICRHTYATMALLATKDLGSVQASLGHTNSRMTEKYAKVVALLNSSTAEKTAKLFNLSENHTRIHTRVLPMVKKI